MVNVAPPSAEPIRPEFTFSSEGELIHHCGKPGEYVLGDVEVMYCSGCFEVDGQLIKATSTALKAFKETDYTLEVELPKLVEVRPKDYASITVPFIRAWRFSATCEGGKRYRSLVVLTPEGTYAVTA